MNWCLFSPDRAPMTDQRNKSTQSSLMNRWVYGGYLQENGGLKGSWVVRKFPSACDTWRAVFPEFLYSLVTAQLVGESFLPSTCYFCYNLGTGPCESCNFQEFPETCKFHLLPEAVFQLGQHSAVPHRIKTGSVIPGPQISFYCGRRIKTLPGEKRLVLSLGKNILAHDKDPVGRVGKKKCKASSRMHDICVGQRQPTHYNFSFKLSKWDFDSERWEEC